MEPPPSSPTDPPAPAPPPPPPPSPAPTLPEGYPAADRFINALSLALIRDVGWEEVVRLPVSDRPGGKRLLTDGQTGILLLRGDGVSLGVIEEEVQEWKRRLEGRGLPPTWRKVLLLYVFGVALEPERRRAIPRTRASCRIKAFALPDGEVRAACVDLAQGGAETGLGRFSPVRAAVTALLREWQAGERMVGTTLYRAGVAEEDLRIRRFVADLLRMRPWVTWILVACCVGLWGWTYVWLAAGDRTLTLLRFGANYGPLVREGEWWRLFGAMFLHAGLVHLAVNMLSLLAVGSTLERYYGHVRYAALYAVAGLAGSLASASWMDRLSVGASGAIFGLCGAVVWMGRRYRAEIPARLRRQLAGGMVPCIGYNLLFGFLVPGIDNAAHLGGLVAGLAFAALVAPAATLRPAQRLRPAAAAVLLVAGIAPFAAEGVVLWRAADFAARLDLVRVEFRSVTGGFALLRPAMLHHGQEGGLETFSCPGLSVDVMGFDVPPGLELERDYGKLVRAQYPSYGFHELRHEVVTTGGRRWVLVDGASWSRGGREIRLAYGRVDARMFCLRLRVSVEGWEMGQAVLAGMLESFRKIP